MVALTNPQFEFITQEQAAGIPIIGVSGDGPGTAGFQIFFTSAVTPEQIAQANKDAAKFNWTPQPAPNFIAFGAACFADATLDLPHKQFVALLLQATYPLTTFQAIYAQGVTSFGPGDAGIATIAAYLIQFNVLTSAEIQAA